MPTAPGGASARDPYTYAGKFGAFASSEPEENTRQLSGSLRIQVPKKILLQVIPTILHYLAISCTKKVFQTFQTSLIVRSEMIQN